MKKEQRRSRTKERNNNLKDYYLATGLSTKVTKSTPGKNGQHTTLTKLEVKKEKIANEPTTFLQEATNFWCTAFGDLDTDSSKNCCSSGCTSDNASSVCSSGIKDVVNDNRNPDDRNPLRKKIDGRRDNQNLTRTFKRSTVEVKDDYYLLKKNESHKIMSPSRNDVNKNKRNRNCIIKKKEEIQNSQKDSGTTITPTDENMGINEKTKNQDETLAKLSHDDTLNRFLQRIETTNDVIKRDIKRKQKILTARKYSPVDVNLNSNDQYISRDDCDSTIQTTDDSTIITFDESNHCHIYQKSPRFVVGRENLTVSNELPELPCVEEEEEKNYRLCTINKSVFDSFDDELSMVALKPAFDDVKLSGRKTMRKRDLIQKVLPALVLVQPETTNDNNELTSPITSPTYRTKKASDNLSIHKKSLLIQASRCMTNTSVNLHSTKISVQSFPSTPTNYPIVNVGCEHDNIQSKDTHVSVLPRSDVHTNNHLASTTGGNNGEAQHISHVTAPNVDNVHNGNPKLCEGSIKTRHSVVGSLIIEKLRKYFPFHFQLKYSMHRDGSGVQTVVEKTELCNYTTLLVVETVNGEAFGVFTAKPWNVTQKFHSGPESFLWRLRVRQDGLTGSVGDDVDDIELFPFIGKSPDVHFCNLNRFKAAVKTISQQGGVGSDCDSFGSTFIEWGFGLAFQRDIRIGTSTASKLFNSPSLSEKSQFFVSNIEFWTISS